jgi:hypothetical protein
MKKNRSRKSRDTVPLKVVGTIAYRKERTRVLSLNLGVYSMNKPGGKRKILITTANVSR